MELLLAQFGNDETAWLIYIILFVLFYLTWLPGQVIMYLFKAKRQLEDFEYMLISGRRIVAEVAKEYGCGDEELKYIDRAMDFFTIEPVSIDPSGILRRLEHLINVSRRSLNRISRILAPNAGSEERANFENMLVTVMVLNIIYKYARHLYMIGKKTRNIHILAQLDIILPQLKEIAKAYYNSFYATVRGVPVGDGIGPMVAAHLMGNAETKLVSEDIVMAEVNMDNRRVLVIKAAGPGGRIGKPGDAVRRIVEELRGGIDLIVTIDAALKLEGEKSGSIAEGIGAAIGDPGPEKFKIEDVATKYDIPLHAIVIKEDIKEALAPITKEIVDAVETVVERVRELIRELVPENGTALVVGIGNTMGIGNGVELG